MSHQRVRAKVRKAARIITTNHRRARARVRKAVRIITTVTITTWVARKAANPRAWIKVKKRARRVAKVGRDEESAFDCVWWYSIRSEGTGSSKDQKQKERGLSRCRKEGALSIPGLGQCP